MIPVFSRSNLLSWLVMWYLALNIFGVAFGVPAYVAAYGLEELIHVWSHRPVVIEYAKIGFVVGSVAAGWTILAIDLLKGDGD